MKKPKTRIQKAIGDAGEVRRNVRREHKELARQLKAGEISLEEYTQRIKPGLKSLGDSMQTLRPEHLK